MSDQCAECECDDASLSCHDPRTPPLDLGICLCKPCGETAYRDRIQEIYDDMNDEIGLELTNKLWNEVLR